MSKLVCIECLSDSYLQANYADNDVDECDYCNEVRPVVTLEELVEGLEEAIQASFTYVEQPSAVIHHGYPEVGHSIFDVLRMVLGADDINLLSDLEGELREQWSECEDDNPFFIEETYASSQLTSDWAQMQRSLQFESRLVNPVVGRVLEKIFSGIEELHTASEPRSAITHAGPGQSLTAFQRARKFEDEEGMAAALKHPEKYLGPTPRGKGSAGRMNAAGISVFYGATDNQTAIAEVRPPVGSWVVTATFEVIRPLRLLNLGDLDGIRPDADLSYFDPVRQDQAERCAFLRELQQQMLIPVMPESADQGYLITQAIADYLATNEALNLDGILFPSVQVPKDASPGLNAILFHKASGVEKTEDQDALDQVSLWESDEDQWVFYPQIWEGNPSTKESVHGFMDHIHAPEASLRLARGGISIHKIQGVSFTYKSDPVRHETWSDGARHCGIR